MLKLSFWLSTIHSGLSLIRLSVEVFARYFSDKARYLANIDKLASLR